MGPASSYGERPVAINGLQAVDDTERFWTEWAGGIRYDGRWQDAVRRSLVTLKALTYEPSGGIVAAATTSLPETLGGSRNWDYRYCWIRDTSFTLNALLGAGLLEEGRLARVGPPDRGRRPGLRADHVRHRRRSSVAGV